MASSPVEGKNVTAEMVTPRGRAIPLTAADADFAPSFRYSQTNLPGTYRARFKTGRETLAEVPFQVARDAQESNLTVLDPSAREQLAKSFGVRFEGVISDGASHAVRALPGVNQVALTPVNGYTQLTVVTPNQHTVLPRLIETLSAHGAVLQKITPEEVTLEDVFIARLSAEESTRA